MDARADIPWILTDSGDPPRRVRYNGRLDRAIAQGLSKYSPRDRHQLTGQSVGRGRAAVVLTGQPTPNGVRAPASSLHGWAQSLGMDRPNVADVGSHRHQRPEAAGRTEGNGTATQHIHHQEQRTAPAARPYCCSQAARHRWRPPKCAPTASYGDGCSCEAVYHGKKHRHWQDSSEREREIY